MCVRSPWVESREEHDRELDWQPPNPTPKMLPWQLGGWLREKKRAGHEEGTRREPAKGATAEQEITPWTVDDHPLC